MTDKITPPLDALPTPSFNESNASLRQWESMMKAKKEQISTIYLDIYKDLKAAGLSMDEAANVRAAIKDGKIRHVKIVEAL